MIYQWRNGSHFESKADAQVVGARLETIKQRKGDKTLTAADVVADASKRGSPLHPLFEWNDTVAANTYREMQARQVIASIVVTVKKRNEPAQEQRAFVAVNSGRKRDDMEGYLMVADIPSGEYTDMINSRARQELRNWVVRYAGVEALEDLVEKVKEAVDEESLAFA